MHKIHKSSISILEHRISFPSIRNLPTQGLYSYKIRIRKRDQDKVKRDQDMIKRGLYEEIRVETPKDGIVYIVLYLIS